MNKTLSRLNQMISEVLKNSQSQNTIDVLNNMLYLMSQDCNLSSLAGNVIKLLPIPNLLLKKVVCSYLVRYSGSVSDISILTTNSLRKDFADPNPHIRKLVIKTVCSIPCVKDLSLELLPRALQDPSVHVRRTAAACCPKVISVNDDRSSDIIDQLYAMIRDEDPFVVCNSLMALEEILESEGGVVINYKMVRYLVGRTISFPDWCVSSVCEVLRKYKPKNAEEALAILNIIDPKLSDRRLMIIFPIMNFALSCIEKHNRNLEKDILDRVQYSLLLALSESCAEVFYVAIIRLENLIHCKPDIFSRNYKQFLCRFNDPVYLKIKKLSLFPMLMQENNSRDIVEDTLCHLTVSKEISKQAVKTLIELLNIEDVLLSKDIEILLQLMTSNHHNLVEEIVVLLSAIDLYKLKEWKNSILLAISENCDQISSERGKNALLSIICEYGENMDNVPYILEQMFCDEVMKNETTCISLLTASVKTFMFRPAEMQLLLGQILQNAAFSSSLLVRTQATFYNTLLQANLDIVAKVLNCQIKQKVDEKIKKK